MSHIKCKRDLSVQAALEKEKQLVRKLETKLSHAYPPCELRNKLKTQQHNALLLQEQLETAQAAANATKEMTSRYEHEIRRLRSALKVHAAEFQDGSQETVHSSLIVALAEVRSPFAQVFRAFQVECFVCHLT
jgi:hypothetical protein